TSSNNELEISYQFTEKYTNDFDNLEFYKTDLNENCVGSIFSIHAIFIFNNYNISTSNSYIESTSDDNLHFSYNSYITSNFDIDSEKANKNT
ncbi:17153_t:CDS:2, partial [Cetraspora pellucida]